MKGLNRILGLVLFLILLSVAAIVVIVNPFGASRSTDTPKTAPWYWRALRRL